jgi:quercetin dioxygenase-like cupin family protein
MKPLFVFGPALVAASVFMSTSSGQQRAVEKSGQHSALKIEHVIAGHLQELNGKYKVRVTEVTYDPKGFIGSHHHAGPGIRCVTSGQLSYEQVDKTAIYKKGDCF